MLNQSLSALKIDPNEKQFIKSVKSTLVQQDFQFEQKQQLNNLNCLVFRNNNIITVNNTQINNMFCSSDYLIQPDKHLNEFMINCVDINSIQNCHIQIDWQEQICLECRQNYKVNKDRKKCLKQKKNQKIQNQQQKCLMCKSQYYLQNQQCKLCQQNCKVCHPFEKEQCYQCIENFSNHQNFCYQDKEDFMNLKNIAQILSWKKLIILMVGIIIFN